MMVYLKGVVCSVLFPLLLSATNVPQPPSSIPFPAGCNSWVNIFNDDFDSTAYNKSNWAPHADWNGNNSFNSGRELYYESQVQVSNGICHLVADLDSTVPYDDFTGTYKSGEILSCRETADASEPYKFKFMYGYIEASIWIVDLPGFFGAFWMLPTKTNYLYEWEIDILEVLGHDVGTMHQTYHYHPGLANDVVRDSSWGTLNNPGRNGTAPNQSFKRAFHTFGCDWQPDRLAFYIDGVEAGVFSSPGVNNENIPNSPGYIILQHMVENTWIRDTGMLIPKLGLSESFDIEYVRVWQGIYDSTVGVVPSPILEEFAAITLGPNPAINSFYFTGSAQVPPQVQLLNASGELVALLPVRNRIVDLEAHIISGLYYVRDEAGSFIKQIMIVR